MTQTLLSASFFFDKGFGVYRTFLSVMLALVTLSFVGCSGKSQIEAPKVTGSVPQKLNEKDNARSVS